MPHDVLSRRLLESTIRGLATADLQACTVFDSVGFRFDTDGESTVAEACERHDVDPAAVVAELTARATDGCDCDPAPRWWALDEACRRVVRVHHAPLRSAIAELRRSVGRFAGTQGESTAGVGELQARLADLEELLLMHFDKEEHVLFPAFAALADACRVAALAPQFSALNVAYPIDAMAAEHDHIEAELAAVCRCARGIVPPEDGAKEWQRWERRLEQFASELAAHARFEDQLLFPTALELERALV